MNTATKLDALKRQREELLTTLKTVEDFPKNFDYDCMVPLTSVAFQPGKLVHTNEFYVTDNGSAVDAAGASAALTALSDGQQQPTGGAWKSYFEAAETLRERMQVLDAQLPKAAPARVPARAPAEESKPIPAQRSQQQTTATSGRDKLLPAPISKAVAASVLPTALQALPPPPSSKQLPAASTTAAATAGASAGAATGVFEIREFIDDAGNVTGHEIVDLAKQMKEIQRNVNAAMAADEANKNTSSAAGGRAGDPTTGSGDGGSTDNAKLHTFASSINDMTQDMEDIGLVDDEDPDEYTGGPVGSDSSCTGRGRDRDSADDALARLSALELEEDEWNAAERFREQERAFQGRQKEEQERAELPQASPGGWKKGFLGGRGGDGSGDKKAAGESRQQQQPRQQSPQTRDDVASAPATATATAAATIVKQKVRWTETAEVAVPETSRAVPPTVSANSRSNAGPKPLAFTGTVMERFP